MEHAPISPWDEQAERISPDGRFRAVFENGMEIAMGAPTMGRLHIRTPAGEDHLVADDAAASFVWSDDSRFLAFSRWRSNRRQSLCVLRLEDMAIDQSPGEFRVIELNSFTAGRIEGVDSPVHQPRTLSLEYRKASEPFDTTC